jgi:hypothetical protein
LIRLLRKLIQKLKSYGIKENLLKWIHSFLSERRQRVVLGDVALNWVDVTSGVPQGSVLGLLMCMIFINDLPEVVTNRLNLYADDSEILSVANNWTEALKVQEDLDSVSKWMNDWGMQLNIENLRLYIIGKEI